MSSTLHWKPADTQGNVLDDELKFALRKAFSDPVDVVLSRQSHILLIEGMRCAGVKGATQLLVALNKHNNVHVKEYF